MIEKFKNVPKEKGTVLITEQEAKLGDIDVLYQKWGWGLIMAESFIFCNEDVAQFNDEELKEEVKSSPMVKEDSLFTVKKSDSGFTFVNFNFENLE
jgi:hypothetical protein